MRFFLLSFLSIMVSFCASAATAKVKKVEGLIPEAFQGPSSGAQLQPFDLILNQGEKKFVFVYVTMDVTWEEGDKQLEFTFEDVNLLLESGPVSPVGSAHADGRLESVSQPKYEKLRAMKDWGNKEIRFCALFHVPVRQEYRLKVLTETVKVPAKQVKTVQQAAIQTEVLGSQLLDEYAFNTKALNLPADQKRGVLRPTVGKVLAVRIKVTPNFANTIGADMRVIFKPRDYHLAVGGQIIPLKASVGNRALLDSTIYNISANSQSELQKKSQEVELLYLVDPKDAAWKLYYGDFPVSEISAR